MESASPSSQTESGIPLRFLRIKEICGTKLLVPLNFLKHLWKNSIVLVWLTPFSTRIPERVKGLILPRVEPWPFGVCSFGLGSASQSLAILVVFLNSIGFLLTSSPPMHCAWWFFFMLVSVSEGNPLVISFLLITTANFLTFFSLLPPG